MQHTNSPKVQLILPSLIQSKTTEREDSHSESIVTLNTPTGYPSNEDTEPENESDHSQHSISSRSSMSSSPSDTVNTYRHHDFGSGDDTDDTSSSSDWEPSISLASTYLPRNNKKSNAKLDLETYNSLLETDHASQLKLKQLENINNILFYPYTNLQSVIFSNSYCYIESDYKKIKNVNLNETNDIDNDSITDMNWNDTQSVNKIKDLLRNLLVSASLTIGIREEEIYLMFTSPSPQEIIEQLRFGILSILCDVHIDRFGRRSYYRKNINYNDRSNKIKIHTSISTEDVHFYNHSHLPTNLFGINDINNLSSFLTESPTVTTQSTPMTPSTDYDSYPPLPDNNINNNMHNNISPPVSDNNNLSPPIYPKRKINKQQLQKEKHKRNINKIHKSIKTIHMSEDKLDWKNIDYHQPVTYLLTKTKTTTYNNHNVKRTATDIGNKHMHNKLKNKKSNHKINKIKPISILSSLPEERAKNIKVKKRKSITTNKNKKNIKNRNKNKNKSKMKIKSKPNNKLINNKSPKQTANNKTEMKVARVKRKVFKFNDSDNELQYIHENENEKNPRKRKVTFEENTNTNTNNNNHIKVHRKIKRKVKMKSMTKNNKQKSYSPKSKPMIEENKIIKKKRRYTATDHDSNSKPPMIKIKRKHRSYSGDGDGIEQDKNSKKMSANEFKNINLYEIIGKNNNLNDNYEIAKDISKYFDNIFGDTDTVCLVSEIGKQPAISYWIKGQYVRKDRNILNGKYVLIYRSCKHIPANKPIIKHNEFEKFVKNISIKYNNKSVNFICEKLDEKFGDGCHFIRCHLKTYNAFDVYCRFSDQYECSFKLMDSKHYIIAWRR